MFVRFCVTKLTDDVLVLDFAFLVGWSIKFFNLRVTLNFVRISFIYDAKSFKAASTFSFEKAFFESFILIIDKMVKKDKLAGQVIV